MDTAFDTKRLTLRPGRADDLDALHGVMTNAQAMRYWDRPPHTDIDQTRQFLDHFMGADVSDREEYILDFEGRCVGKAGLWKRYELGYILCPSCWGRGLVPEACAAILPRAWAKFPDATVITAECDPRNIGSIRVLEKLGFRHDRTEEKNFLYGDSEWCDTAYYGLTRP